MKRKLKQPTKDALRKQLALAANRIIALGVEIAGKNEFIVFQYQITSRLQSRIDRRWWHRFAWWRK